MNSRLFISLILIIVLVFGKANANDKAFWQLEINNVLFAQTHVLSDWGTTWVLSNKTHTFELVGNRETLVMVEVPTLNFGRNPVLEVYIDENNGVPPLTHQGDIYLRKPKDLPPTENNGPFFSTTHYSATIPANWVKPRMVIRFHSGIIASSYMYPMVGQDTSLLLWTLPFYLFGANDTNTYSFNVTDVPDKYITDELYQKWSVSEIVALNHPLKRIDWPYIIIPPRSGRPAIRIKNADEMKEGYDIMSSILDLLSHIRYAFGERATANQIYSPILALDSKGKYRNPYGGLGGGKRGTGDHSYTGIFIHEQGHAFGMPHSGEAYDSGKNPYINGSLKGSTWGYDSQKKCFLSPFIPSSASDYKNCNKSKVTDDKGNCYKQSVMQGGSGTQDPSFRFAMFQDFEMSIIQEYFKNSISYNAKNNSYSQWNSLKRKYEDFQPVTKQSGLYGVDGDFPIQRDIEIYTVLLSVSRASSPSELSQFYPPLKTIGNLMRSFDPTDNSSVSQVIPGSKSTYKNYCYSSGCDYTIRATYEGDLKRHYLVPIGDRVWGKPDSTFKQNMTDIAHSDSFFSYGLNIPADKVLQKLELLHTYLGWNLLNSTSAKVLFSRDLIFLNNN
ncbi:hypothetical protein DLAC_11514 [Tieghemostelium lacteum]|uniref:Peptidase M66 domain-containing protein n=1 Tax=Tieghemostelium lacteum TaxID=361077 RepID=A0A152A458_TIELA|nr:hypothetical protein DLAC_11514 [Tieghemostelium lacteum]|eukprot:KYR01004.1 hypothetical protein DLAC_11514 [Tieghemostelium lacteum]